jgi:hypothetical protein
LQRGEGGEFVKGKRNPVQKDVYKGYLKKGGEIFPGSLYKTLNKKRGSAEAHPLYIIELPIG